MAPGRSGDTRIHCPDSRRGTCALLIYLEKLRHASEDGSGEFQEPVPDLENVSRADVHATDPDQVPKRVRARIFVEVRRSRQDREGGVEL